MYGDATEFELPNSHLRFSILDGTSISIEEIIMGMPLQSKGEIIKRSKEFMTNPVRVFTKNIEATINRLGYRVFISNKINEALILFEANVELYPDSDNAWDSLGETLATAGNEQEAIRAYKKALELNPNNTGAVEALKKLQD